MKPWNRALDWVAGTRIGTRLAMAFGSVLALTALLGAAAVVNLDKVNQTSNELAAKWLPTVGAAGALRATMLEYRELQIKHARAQDASYMSEYEDKMKEAEKGIGERLAEIDRLVDTNEERKLLQGFVKLLGDFRAFNAKVIQLGRGGKPDDARDIGDGAGKMAADEAIEALDRFSAFNFAGARKTEERADAVYASARYWTFGLVGSALAIGLALTVLITRGLLGQLGGEPRVAAAVARAVAGGDLTSAIALKAGDTHSLMAGLHHMQMSLSQVVTTVRQNSQRVASASGEIAQGNNDLSGRTEKQAGALEETAASMQQLGATVHRNADHARQADEMAGSASKVAIQGGESVARVVQTMRGINESSHRIADIIGVIDDIAFQTNILALNAAVEAARAGEQGRGFAVVAGEVRGLAKRSADAAREIKSLIAASVECVAQGTSQVDEAGATMTEVVAAIGRVTTLMRQISTATQEQSTGVARVGVAVGQIDKATQQNAALVEESAAAAESLREQAQELVAVVAAFRLVAA